MNWYYADQQQQKGPFNDNDFQNLVRQGVITGDTLVWREGMPEWLPYASISPAGVPSAAEASASACGVCGKSLPPQDLIQFEGVNVCAACKPAFLQKLKEDSTIPMQMEYAGFWIRFGAVFLDGLILSVPYYIVYFSVLVVMAKGSPEQMGFVQIGLSLLQMLVALFYEVLMIGKYGATLGKMAVKIKVVTAEGGRVSYGRATGRYFAKILSQIVLMIGYIMAGFDKEKRALHDIICGTRVIRRS